MINGVRSPGKCNVRRTKQLSSHTSPEACTSDGPVGCVPARPEGLAQPSQQTGVPWLPAEWAHRQASTDGVVPGGGTGPMRPNPGGARSGLHRRLGAAHVALLLAHHPAAEQAQREEADGQHDAARGEGVSQDAVLRTERSGDVRRPSAAAGGDEGDWDEQ